MFARCGSESMQEAYFVVFTSFLFDPNFWTFFLKNFCEFLEENKDRFSNLRSLTLVLRNVPATAMSGQTVIALLRHSNVDNLNCLFAVPFTDLQLVRTTFKLG